MCQCHQWRGSRSPGAAPQEQLPDPNKWEDLIIVTVLPRGSDVDSIDMFAYIIKALLRSVLCFLTRHITYRLEHLH